LYNVDVVFYFGLTCTHIKQNGTSRTVNNVQKKNNKTNIHVCTHTDVYGCN